MKKIFVLLIISLLLVGCGSQSYTKVDYNELTEKLNNKDSFVLVIGSSTCAACKEYKVTMEEIMTKYNLEIYNIEIDSLSEEDGRKFSTAFTFQYTPTTIFIVNGEEKTTYDRLEGAASNEEVIKLLKKYNYIEGDE